MEAKLTAQSQRPLTDVQMAALRLRARGMSNAEVAYELGVREQTVKNHMLSIHKRLNVNSLVGAMNALGWVKIR